MHERAALESERRTGGIPYAKTREAAQPREQSAPKLFPVKNDGRIRSFSCSLFYPLDVQFTVDFIGEGKACL